MKINKVLTYTSYNYYYINLNKVTIKDYHCDHVPSLCRWERVYEYACDAITTFFILLIIIMDG